MGETHIRRGRKRGDNGRMSDSKAGKDENLAWASAGRKDGMETNARDGAAGGQNSPQTILLPRLQFSLKPRKKLKSSY